MNQEKREIKCFIIGFVVGGWQAIFMIFRILVYVWVTELFQDCMRSNISAKVSRDSVFLNQEAFLKQLYGKAEAFEAFALVFVISFQFCVNSVLLCSFNSCENISEIFEQIKIRLKFSDKIVLLQYLFLNEKKEKYIYILSLENIKCRDFPLGPMGKTPLFQCRGALVQFLVKQLDPTCHN